MPCGLKTLLGPPHGDFAYGQARIFIGWCHVCVTAKEKFDASRNSVRESSGADEVIHAPGLRHLFFFKVSLGSSGCTTSCKWTWASSTPSALAPTHTHTKLTHTLLSSSNTTLAVIWGLFVIFSGALSGRRSDISVSAQKPQSGVTHN